jgi:aspartyl-tRNA(Asn)/glutamyl-tRNA(Gln) amidotransferase subunit A
MTPGGSSAGSGVAVATGMAPLALGGDGGGSVRIPAAHCGVYGLKASMGRVPLYPGCRDERYPGLSSWESLEHIGPITRTVDDAALLMSVLAGPDPRDRHSLPAGDVDWPTATRGGIAGMRVAFSADFGYLAVDPEVREIATRAAEVFATDLGCTVEHADPGWSDPFADFWSLVVADSDLTGMRALAAEHGSEMAPNVVAMLAQSYTAEQFTDANIARQRLVNRMWRFMADHDLLLTPTLAVPPFPVHVQGPEVIDGRMVSSAAWLGFTFPMNMTGQPAASVPAGFTAAGLPVGLQIVGRHLADGDVLRASAAFEQAAPWADRWPALVAG